MIFEWRPKSKIPIVIYWHEFHFVLLQRSHLNKPAKCKFYGEKSNFPGAHDAASGGGASKLHTEKRIGYFTELCVVHKGSAPMRKR